MRPRRDRWLSLLEVASLLGRHRQELLAKSKRLQRRHVLRLVRQCERRDGSRISRRVGRQWFVSRNAIDALQQWEPESLSELERSVEDLHAKVKEHGRRLNAHGADIRNLKAEQQLARDYLSGMARLKGTREAHVGTGT